MFERKHFSRQWLYFGSCASLTVSLLVTAGCSSTSDGDTASTPEDQQDAGTATDSGTGYGRLIERWRIQPGR